MIISMFCGIKIYAYIYSGSLEFKFMVILMIQKLNVPSLELDKLGNLIFNFSGPNSFVLGMERYLGHRLSMRRFHESLILRVFEYN